MKSAALPQPSFEVVAKLLSSNYIKHWLSVLPPFYALCDPLLIQPPAKQYRCSRSWGKRTKLQLRLWTTNQKCLYPSCAGVCMQEVRFFIYTSGRAIIIACINPPFFNVFLLVCVGSGRNLKRVEV